MLTAAITGAIAWVLSLFGIKPGPYLVAVAAVVKGIIILAGVLIGARAVRKRKAREAAKHAAAPSSLDAPGPDRTEKT